MQFKIEQFALYVEDIPKAKELLKDMGLSRKWIDDTVVGQHINKSPKMGTNVGNLAYNYEALKADVEFELLNYPHGEHFLQWSTVPRASHIGMHCTEEELDEWRGFFHERGISLAQELKTVSHSNLHIAGKRRYHYAIFDTVPVLGVYVKLIVRENLE